MSAIITARNLSRWYGIVMGLNNISFEVHPGITGLVGPNGAGKSTLIQIITGQLQPSSGVLSVFDQKPWNNPRVLQRIGFCPERESVPKDLRPMIWLTGLGLLSGMEQAVAEKRASQVLDRVKLLPEHRSKTMGQYSKGMRQRVKLAQTLLHHPDLILLDEPMNGLDPMGRQEMASILRQLTEEGVSIIISSHILSELEPLCRNILILNWGRVLASGGQLEIRQDLKDWSEQLSVRCDDPEKLARFLFDAGMLRGFDLDLKSSFLSIRIKDPTTFYEKWIELLIASGVTLFEIRSQSRSLKNVFDKVTAG